MEGMAKIEEMDFLFPASAPTEVVERAMEGFESLRKGVGRLHCKFAAAEVEPEALEPYHETLRDYDHRWAQLIEFIVGVYEKRPLYASLCANLVEELTFISASFRAQRVARRPILPWLLHTSISVDEVSWGVHWYTITRVEGGASTQVKRRFNNFRDLDWTLRSSGSIPPEGLPPPLPDTGFVGIRHRLGLQGFNQRRLEGLQEYLDALAANPDTAHILRNFLSEPDPAARRTSLTESMLQSVGVRI
jgi:hypothetical protein